MKHMYGLTVTLAGSVFVAACGGDSVLSNSTSAAQGQPTRIIVTTRDGSRPDSINTTDTLNPYTLCQAGVNFSDNHSTYPTFTIINGSSFTAGAFPGTGEFYGNTFWMPPQGATSNIPVDNLGTSSSTKTVATSVNYIDSIFTEDCQVLTTLNNYYGRQPLLVKGLFAVTQTAGLTTVTVGKSGAASTQDLGQGGYSLDGNTIQPRGPIIGLQSAGYVLSFNMQSGYSRPNAVALVTMNGDPITRASYVTFDAIAYDNVSGVTAVATRDGSDATQGIPEDAVNKYILSVFTNYILPKKQPMLSLIWFHTPDNVEHGYGLGLANAIAGLRSQDRRLGKLVNVLKANNLHASINLIVVLDHDHSSVSDPLSLYPLHTITPPRTTPGGTPVNGVTSGADITAIGAISITGYSFSSDVHPTDLLTYRDFKAYNGSSCTTSVMYGLQTNGTPIAPVEVDTIGSLCGAANTKCRTINANLATPVASFKVPAPGNPPANDIVMATNGGSGYFYVPSHDPTTVQNLIGVLQQHEEYGAIFINSRYDALPGTLPTSVVNLENAQRQNSGQSSVVTGFNWDDQVVIKGMSDIEFESAGSRRDMHGSFSTTDMHDTLIASGPSFCSSTAMTNPIGNVNVASTVAYLLGLSMPWVDGRILGEVLLNPASPTAPSVRVSTMSPVSPITGLSFEVPAGPTGAIKDAVSTQGNYTINLAVEDLSIGGKTYRYFNYTKVVRQ